MMMRGALILLFTLLFGACTGPDDAVDKAVKLTSIAALEKEYTIESGGSVEVLFRVEHPLALFNYATSSPNCQVELRLVDNPTQQPTEVTLVRIEQDSSERGTYHATIKDNGSAEMFKLSTYIAIKLSTGEVVRSNPIQLISSNFVGGIATVRLTKRDNPTLLNDIKFEYNPALQSFSGKLTNIQAESRFIPEFTSNSVDKIEINGVEYTAATPVDFSNDVAVVAHSEGKVLRYTLHLEHFSSGIPILTIETPERQEITSKEDWIEGATMTLDGLGMFEDIDAIGLSIRGRGNSTWLYDKKPYALKLDKKHSVMGMPKHKRWVLLANYMDRTLLRNRVAFFLAGQTSLSWTPRGEFVELVLNGKHLGQYFLCEHIKVDESRVNITEMSPEDTSGEAITGGYLLELDFHYDNVWQWHTSHGVPFAVKSPEEEDIVPEQLKWIKEYIRNTEDALYSDKFTDKESGYQQYIDAQSFIDYWLIYEICVNHELANPGSVYMTKERGGKLVAGPIWDFDWGTFSYKASPQAQWGLFMTHAWWYDRLFEDPNFKALAVERWKVLTPKFMEVFDFIRREQEYIRKSWDVNAKTWRINTDTNGDERLTFDDAVNRLTDITRNRIDIISRELQ